MLLDGPVIMQSVAAAFVAKSSVDTMLGMVMSTFCVKFFGGRRFELRGTA